jgi:ADP-ribose pyrophosphatase YjhB (NUDIX family)
MLKCPECGAVVSPYRNPALTVDIIIEHRQSEDDTARIIYITRKNEPVGTALPGGFVDYGETVETAAVREAREETGLSVELVALHGVYSAPDRDPRGHTVSVVFIARATGRLAAGDDAESVFTAPVHKPPDNLVFDHRQIVQDYINS